MCVCLSLEYLACCVYIIVLHTYLFSLFCVVCVLVCVLESVIKACCVSFYVLLVQFCFLSHTCCNLLQCSLPGLWACGLADWLAVCLPGCLVGLLVVATGLYGLRSPPWVLVRPPSLRWVLVVLLRRHDSPATCRFQNINKKNPILL